jgi:hypothetical protein
MQRTPCRCAGDYVEVVTSSAEAEFDGPSGAGAAGSLTCNFAGTLPT